MFSLMRVVPLLMVLVSVLGRVCGTPRRGGNRDDLRCTNVGIWLVLVVYMYQRWYMTCVSGKIMYVWRMARGAWRRPTLQLQSCSRTLRELLLLLLYPWVRV